MTATVYAPISGSETADITPRAHSPQRDCPLDSAQLLPVVDAELAAHLAGLSSNDPDFWTFPKRTSRADIHGYYQYPAMMVARVQREIMTAIQKLQFGVRSVYDPFAGSGIVLGEAMSLGLDVYCKDVNPLAVLLCLARSGPFSPGELRLKSQRLTTRLSSDRSDSLALEFPNRAKWFREGAIRELSRLQRAIRGEPDLWARRFFWVTLAETVRLTSNSRTSTYKLHIRPKEEIGDLPSPTSVFEKLVERNLSRHEHLKQELDKSGRLRDGCYVGNVRCLLGNAVETIDDPYDTLVTSPPYGDNVSTVPYGQSSYLPLQWIDFADIDSSTDIGSIKTTHEIDSRSLGGKRPRPHERLEQLAGDLCERSASFKEAFFSLADEPRDRRSRVFAFVRDLDKTLEPITRGLRPNGYAVFTVGNRRVGNKPMPLDRILAELLAAHGLVPVVTIDRRITSKRMATRNSIAATMRAESLLIFRKTAGAGTTK